MNQSYHLSIQLLRPKYPVVRVFFQMNASELSAFSTEIVHVLVGPTTWLSVLRLPNSQQYN